MPFPPQSDQGSSSPEDQGGGWRLVSREEFFKVSAKEGFKI